MMLVNGLECGDMSVKPKIVLETPVKLNSVRLINCGEIGGFTYICPGSVLNNVKSVGRFCSIAENVVMWNRNHCAAMLSTHPMFTNVDTWWNKNFWEGNSAEVYEEIRIAIKVNRSCNKKSCELIIGNDVWIGNGAKILEGVHVGNGAIIGAGAVVTRDVPPYAVVGGVPAKVIRYRFEEEIIVIIENLKWWLYGTNILKDLNLMDISTALKLIHERIECGFPQYKGEKFCVYGEMGSNRAEKLET